MELQKIKGIDIVVNELTSKLAARKSEVTEKLAPYVNGVVTEETVDAWKKDRASLNKERTDSEKERTGLEATWKSVLAPVSDAYKEIKNEYDKAIANIDSQTKEFEAKRVQEKKELIIKIFREYEAPEEIKGWLSLADVYNNKWENKGCKEKDIIADITNAYNKMYQDFITIKLMKSSYESEGLEVLRRTHDLASAILKMSEMTEQAIRIKEQIEAERKAKEEEAERKRQIEEQIKIEEEKITEWEIEEVKPTPDGFIFGTPGVNRYKLTVQTEELTDEQYSELMNALTAFGLTVIDYEVI